MCAVCKLKAQKATYSLAPYRSCPYLCKEKIKEKSAPIYCCLNVFSNFYADKHPGINIKTSYIYLINLCLCNSVAVFISSAFVLFCFVNKPPFTYQQY